jgi:hypothetical protein
MPDRLKSGVERLSGLDMSAVRVRRNSATPASLGALASTQGTRIELGPGQERHLGHEAWHVVQQMQGRVVARTDGGRAINADAGLEREAEVMGARAVRAVGGRVGKLRKVALDEHSAPIQRRVPDERELAELVANKTDIDLSTFTMTTTAPADANAHAEGLRTVLRRQIQDIRTREPSGDLGPTMTLLNHINTSGKTVDQIVDTGDANQLLGLAKNILTVSRTDKLLPPEGYMAPPADPAEQNKIQKLVDNAGAIFDLATGGAKDAVITDIFGAGKVADAKKKMALGKAAMLKLFADNKIVTDRSGYSAEVNLGGMSLFGVNVLLPARAIDNPDDGHSIATMFHESMHAGNADVRDMGGYVGSPGFKLHDPDLKVVNAAHYEVIALRDRLGANAVWDGVYSPPGAVVASSGAVVAAPSQTETVLARVSEMFRRSWTAGLWIHDSLLDIYKNPAWWTNPAPSWPTRSYKDWLTYWSPVLGLTIHARPALDAASLDKSKRPVTQIDMSLIESVTKRFALLGQLVPRTEADAFRITNVYPGGDNWNYVFKPEAEADALVAELLRWVTILGNPVKDRATVDSLCFYFSKATGAALPAGQHPPNNYPK